MRTCHDFPWYLPIFFGDKYPVSVHQSLTYFTELYRLQELETDQSYMFLYFVKGGVPDIHKMCPLRTDNQAFYMGKSTPIM